MHNVKFLKKGVKVGQEYFPAHYSEGPYTEHSKLPKGTITVYAKTYKHFPALLRPENNTDMMTDYFEKDKLRITPSSSLFKAAQKAARGR